MRSECVSKGQEYVDKWVEWWDADRGRISGMQTAVIEVVVPAAASLGATFEHAVLAVANVAGKVLFFLGGVIGCPCCSTSSFSKAWAHLNDAFMRGAEACVRIPMAVPRVIILVVGRLWNPEFHEPDDEFKAVLSTNDWPEIRLVCRDIHEASARQVMEAWSNGNGHSCKATPNRKKSRTP